ncbi:hypothetical protein H4R20_001210 [Coemansia guatemalensis]|uniref:Lysozyme n=1 Tax=Coemansia guatemalensis TaxID=2761395 RepID=A0A9W8HXS3_9FUNG|nr:hypothetical protein H4R20_001210 [Coemansia guatemalensis]
MATPSAHGAASSCQFVNRAALDLIKFSEGFVSVSYPDPVGMPTAGYGHQCRERDCREISALLPLSYASAHQLLVADITRFTKALASYIDSSVTLNDNQWGALVSWAFNVGTESVRNSTLLMRINQHENLGKIVAEELPKWDRVGNTVLPGLVSRRAAEVALFNRPSNRTAHPLCLC